MSKKNVVVIFGGMSSEHEISCISVVTIAENIDTEKYNAYLIGITKEGKWLKVNRVESIKDGSWRDEETLAVISPDSSKSLIIHDGVKMEIVKIDVVFPVLHGMYGEDGTIQGLFTMAGIPYVGCGVFASAAAMDKVYTKMVVDTLNIRQAKYIYIRRSALSNMNDYIDMIEAKFSYPVFVKPSKAGSSKGVSKADTREELIVAINEAARYDSKILVEETIVGRELECGVLGYDTTTKASGVGEILAADEFYDYDAKYNNSESKTVIDPELPEGKAEEIRSSAVSIYNALEGFGLSRVDFFLENGTNDVVFNEINTLPGFTSISMYPMLWKARGIEVGKLVETLIEMAYKREY